MLDAYSVRKAIPRVLIAVIAINLSIYICVAMLDITMIIGRSVNGLLVAPFLTDDSFKTIEIEANTSNSILGVLGTTALLAGIVAILINGVIASAIAVIGLLMPIILIVGAIIIAVLFTLIVRQGLLVFLTVISPVAIACYILPGTEKYFKIWLDTFIKTLLIYPIIAVIFAMSNILASILLTSSSSKTATLITNPASMFDVGTRFAAGDANDTVRIIVAILALYAPLLLIPFAFKLAGGVMGGVMKVAGGQANKFGRQSADKFSKMRDKPGGSFDRSKQNARSRREDRGLTMGQVSSGVRSGVRGKGYRNGVQGKTDLLKRVAAKNAGQNPMMQQLAFDDEANAVMALSGGSKAGAQAAAARLGAEHGWDRDKTNRVMATAEAAGGFNSTNAAYALESMAQNKSRMLVGGLSGAAGAAMIRDSATDIAGNNEQLRENLIGNSAYHSRNAGRLDLGAQDGGLDYGWNASTTGAHAQSHGDSMTAYANNFRGNIVNGSDDEKATAAIALAEMQSMLPSASAENQRIINDTLHGLGVRHDNGSGTVEQQLARVASGHAANDTAATPHVISYQDINGRARKYGSDMPVAAAAAGGAPPPPPTPTPTP